jgi:hypothetical protein
LVAVQANTVPQVFTVGSSSAFSALSGSPPTARFAAVVGRFLHLTGLVSNPTRDQWSAIDDITGWTAGVNFSNYVDLPDGGSVKGIGGGEFGLLFQESVRRRLVYQPGASPAFQIERVTEDDGLLGSYSIVRAGGRVAFISPKGAFEFIPNAGFKPIGKEKVDRTLLADIDAGYLHLLIGAADPSATRYLWAYKSAGSSSTTSFDKIIAYDYELERWAPPVAISGEYLAGMVKPGVTLDGLDSVSSSIDALTFSLDSVQAALSARLAAVDTSHRLGFFDGSNVEAILETPEQSLEGRRMRVNVGSSRGPMRPRSTAR